MPSLRLAVRTSLKILNKGIIEKHAQQKQPGYELMASASMLCFEARRIFP